MKKMQRNGKGIVLADANETWIRDVTSALDLIAAVRHDFDAERLAIPKDAVADTFFVLRSGMAGEILQKFINYRVKVAIFGDFSGYTSKPLQAFIAESNGGKDVYFASTQEEAIEWLSK